MKKIISQPFLAVLSCLLLAACETTQTKPEEPPPKPEAKPAPVSVQTTEPALAQPANLLELQVLKEGVALYNNGNYGEAIKKLNSPDIWVGKKDKAVQVDAAKFMAFSYCVTSRAALCKQQFERALKLEPNFDLSPGERGHPLWGPVFLRAKKGK